MNAAGIIYLVLVGGSIIGYIAYQVNKRMKNKKNDEKQD